MSDVGVDAGYGPVWDSIPAAVHPEMWWARSTPPAHDRFVLTIPQYNAARGHLTFAAFQAALPPDGLQWLNAQPPDAQEGVFRVSQIAQAM